MASIIKVDRILDSTEIGKVDIPGGIETDVINATELVANTWKNVDGSENYKCKAWVNFDGTTTPPTIRASGNVSSVVGNNTGDYTVNFITPMEDGNYVMTHAGGVFRALQQSTPTASAYRVLTQSANAGNTNYSEVMLAFFR